MVDKRDYLWDNIKALLIILVVSAHALGISTVNSSIANEVYYWIYSFHMPAFIFVSGFWAKSYCRDGKVRGEKTGLLIAYYMIFQTVFIMIKIVTCLVNGGRFSSISFFNPSRGIWYILALVFYYLMIPVIEKLPAYIVLPVTVVLSLLICRDSSVGNYLGISRAFVFAPFFFAGYYTSADTVRKLSNIKAYIRYPLGLLCMAVSVSIWVFQRNIFTCQLFYGKTSYSKMKLSFSQGALLRLEVIVIATLMIAALIMLMPKGKTFFSYIGKYTLQVFVFHMLMVSALFDSKIFVTTINSVTDFVVAMLISLAVTLILSASIFTYPFKWIQLFVNRIYVLTSKE